MIPKVTLYCEMYRPFNGWYYKGVGTGFITSYKNQKKILEKAGIFYTENLNVPTNIFQANSHSPYTFHLIKKYKKQGKKIIIYAHSTAEDLEKQFRIFHLIVPLLRWYLSKLYNFVDAVACPSEYTATLLNTKYGVPKEKTVFISNGVSLQKFKFDQNRRDEFRNAKKIPADEIVVTNVAMALKRKGLDTFIYLGKMFPNVRFAWFGKIFNILLAPKIPPATPNVTFHGYVPDIMEAYLSADIFLFPSYEEQQGISVLEAGSMGLPILVRDIPVYYGWLIDGENCLKARNNEEFKEKLSNLLQESYLRKKLGNELHKLVVNEHSFENVGIKLNNLYEKLLRN